jgi:hypothetical protein
MARSEFLHWVGFDLGFNNGSTVKHILNKLETARGVFLRQPEGRGSPGSYTREESNLGNIVDTYRANRERQRAGLLLRRPRKKLIKSICKQWTRALGAADAGRGVSEPK